MIREKRQRPNQIIIDLTGPDGNAFALMGYAKQFAKQLGLDEKKILKEMQSSDYENLLELIIKNRIIFIEKKQISTIIETPMQLSEEQVIRNKVLNVFEKIERPNFITADPG